MAEVLPQNQHKYILTKSEIDQRRQMWLNDHKQATPSVKYASRRQPLTREETLRMFYEQQEMNRELWVRLARVRDDVLKDEYHVEQILVADRLTLKWRVSAQMYDQMFREYKLEEEQAVKQEIERSKMPDDLSVRIVQSQHREMEEDMDEHNMV